MVKFILMNIFAIQVLVYQNSLMAIEITSSNLKTLIEQKNSRISASQYQIQATKEKEGVLMRSFFPTVKLSASQERFKTGIDRYRTQPTYGVEGTLNLFNGGKDHIESQIRQSRSNLQTIQAQQVFSLELQKTRSIYWEILYLQDKIQILQDVIEINKTNTNAALKRIRSGVATTTDQLEFDMEAVNLKREFDFAQIQLKNSINSLLVLLNINSQEKIEFKEELIHEHEIEFSANTSPQNYEFQFKDLILNSEINTLHANQEKRNLWPKIDAFGSYYQFTERDKSYISSADRDEYAFGLRISINLPAGLESNRDAAYYHYQAKSSDALASIQKREIETHIQNETNVLTFLHDQVHNADENIKRALAYYKSTQSEYNRGVKNSPDVLAASQRLFEMKHKRLELVRDFQIAKGHLLAQMGQ